MADLLEPLLAAMRIGSSLRQVLVRGVGEEVRRESMSDAEVASVIAVGERMRDEGRDFVSEINRNSLEYRGKKVPSAMRK
eukprot:CAMPEP_0179410740 /NCGR_PEP_ID=MMETSP0799-20121207/3483_1 /TAXON_ID=46947 /ORGANISM="Geminigera cryophila, Strain CCMP2564" /LENGTH=79 /DNA_ID=CAMNT_0021182679 /DNA_START=195 /DNA_END=434 /DNA_ORIENTATION=-